MAGCREEATVIKDYGEYLKEQNQFNASLLPSTLSRPSMMHIDISTNIEHSKVQFGE